MLSATNRILLLTIFLASNLYASNYSEENGGSNYHTVTTNYLEGHLFAPAPKRAKLSHRSSQEASSSQADLPEGFPSDVTTRVLGLLDPRELIITSQVCQQWRDISFELLRNPEKREKEAKASIEEKYGKFDLDQLAKHAAAYDIEVPEEEGEYDTSLVVNILKLGTVRTYVQLASLINEDTRNSKYSYDRIEDTLTIKSKNLALRHPYEDLPQEFDLQIDKLMRRYNLVLGTNGRIDVSEDKLNELGSRNYALLCLKGYVQCKTIDITGKFVFISSQLLESLKLALELNIFDANLAVIPSSIGKLTQLTRLDFSENCLSFLPPEIGRLTNLKKLILSHNALESLPEETKNLRKLESLHINTLGMSANNMSQATLDNIFSWYADNPNFQMDGNNGNGFDEEFEEEDEDDEN